MFNEPQHIVFAGGGTAGHLFPGLAVAHLLRRAELGARITFVGTGKAFERQHVTAAGHEYLVLPSRPFSRHVREALLFLTDNVSGYYAARRFLTAEGVTLVVGLGGYASAATTRAAKNRHVPYVLLEQNAVPGKATRWLAGGAQAVFAAFGEVRSHLGPGCRVRATGTPVRREFLRNRLSPEERLAPYAQSPAANPPASVGGAVAGPRQPRLLVLGGSGGARALNEHVPAAIYKAQAALTGWEVLHQTGERDCRSTAALYEKLGIAARVVPFFDDLPRWLAGADVAISRAGGSTLAELAVCSVPTILLPYPRATGDHQRKNADLFVAAGAARLVDQREVIGRLDNAIAETLIELAGNPALRQQMAARLARIARPDAARQVAQSIADILAARQPAAA
ncbi:MAG TPA: undecaprenyldiphospho-muramoylpentapeptide beta-N-acetylglucosaminyltransferase [Pirellulales bacterium]|jgi:UDP-N-acetylglucosamine--N-acetylmuramyl-(pentapeptide) pyrophosphoryl-undecaprenol N-acetylglucosamine transferase|nr:undecaprenyldiphospho-muramoylpentapeptide beta-N-acetylglucosaminyltransferase [Pirellulales bacterium]